MTVLIVLAGLLGGGAPAHHHAPRRTIPLEQLHPPGTYYFEIPKATG